MEKFNCKVCGGKLIQSGSIWECEYCGNTYEEEKVEFDAASMRKVLDELAEEKVANLRQRLWSKVNAKYIDSEEIIRLSKEIKSYLPDDFFASFCEVANSAPVNEVNEFLDNIDVKVNGDYINIILSFMLKSLKSENLLSLNNLIERAYRDIDLERFDKMTNMLAEEAKKVDAGVYELNMPRDVFVIYSSKDMDIVTNLVAELEKQGLKCFVAMRNLQHGRGAVQNYQHALETAIDNSKVVVFVSSGNSRNLSCDAIRHEIPYIKRKDFERIPPQYRSLTYEKLPSKFKKPRVELRINRGTGSSAADDIVKEFFAGQEYCYTPETVCKRVAEYIVGMSSVLNAEDLEPKEIIREKTVYISDNNSETIRKDGSINNYLKRVVLFLRDGNFDDASDYCDKVLDVDPENCDAYIYKLMCELRFTDKKEFDGCQIDLNKSKNFKNALEFADNAQKKVLLGWGLKSKKNVDIANCKKEAKRAKDNNSNEAENSIRLYREQYQNIRDNRLREINDKKSEIGEISDAITVKAEKLSKLNYSETHSYPYERKESRKGKIIGTILLLIGIAAIGTFIALILISKGVQAYLIPIALVALISGIVKITISVTGLRKANEYLTKIQKEISALNEEIESDKERLACDENELSELGKEHETDKEKEEMNVKINEINAEKDKKNAQIDAETAKRLAAIESETEEQLKKINA